MKATRPHITAPSCKDILNKESKYVKLLDVKSWDDITWKAEYDGNMQTAPILIGQYILCSPLLKAS